MWYWRAAAVLCAIWLGEPCCRSERRTERRNLDLRRSDLRSCAGVVVNKAPNSQVYTHYSERHLKGEPSRQLESPKRLVAAARSKLSRVYEELVNVVLRLRSSH